MWTGEVWGETNNTDLTHFYLPSIYPRASLPHFLPEYREKNRPQAAQVETIILLNLAEYRLIEANWARRWVSLAIKVSGDVPSDFAG